MSRILKTIAAGLVLLPWQASLPVEAGMQQAIRVEIASLGASGSMAAADLLGEVYEQRGFALAWDEPGRVEALLEALRSSYEEGLNPAEYHVTGVEEIQNSSVAGRELSTGEQAAFDLGLTDSLVRLVYHLCYGKVDAETRDATWAFDRRLNGRTPSTVINEIINSDDLAAAISSVVPRDPGYDRLKAQLQQHRIIAAAGGWPELTSGPTIRPESNDTRLKTLARRLAISGDLAADNAWVLGENYDQVLQNAVRRFQARHGLEVDALVGRATLRALNVSVEQRIDQIRLNLERARWRRSGEFETLILINVAGFKAYVIRDRETVWTMKVIIGATEDQTPLFRATLKQVVFNPTWTVPYSIATEEILPKIKVDPDYLPSGKYQLYDRDGNAIDPSAVDWSTIHSGYFPFTVVQQPGPANQLGQVKFVFPNEYSVCMHDTPARYLFTMAGRAFSHGCIRVDKPIDFAEVILAGEGWTREQIDVEIESGETSTVVLAEPLPVVVLYWTAEVDEQGGMHFYDDIYERDAAVLESLDRPL